MVEFRLVDGELLPFTKEEEDAKVAYKAALGAWKVTNSEKLTDIQNLPPQLVFMESLAEWLNTNSISLPAFSLELGESITAILKAKSARETLPLPPKAP